MTKLTRCCRLATARREHILGMVANDIPSWEIVGDDDPFPVLSLRPSHSQLLASLPNDLGEMTCTENADL